MTGRREFLAGVSATLLLAACRDGSKTPAGRLGGADDPSVDETDRGRRRPGAGLIATSLTMGPVTADLAGTTASTVGFAGQLPGPELRVRAGDTLQVEIDNQLAEATSIHWHGIALRNDMDGVADLTQPMIAPGQRFRYQFTPPDPGTFWFHPHTGLLLDRGLHGPLIVDDPAEPGGYDDEVVLVLDDWLDGLGPTPEQALAGLTTMADMGGMDHGASTGGAPVGMALSELLGGDAGDVAYPLYLLNGRPPADPPTITVTPAGRVRLRIINAGSDTAFRFAVGGHLLVVTHSDGFPVKPVEVDALLVGMGERYDVTVRVASGA